MKLRRRKPECDPAEGRTEACSPLSWDTLPTDVLETIFSKIRDLGPLRLVNSCWWSVINRSLKSLTVRTKHCPADVESLGKSLTNLERLQIHSRDEDVLYKLASIKSLTDLDLHWGLCDKSNSKSYGVEGLTNLTSLTLCWTWQNLGSKYMEMLGTLSNLKSLSLKKSSWLGDKSVKHLSGMTNLTSLDLHMFSFTSVMFLSRLTKLKELNLGGWNVNPTPLTTLVNLTRLDLKNAKIGRRDVERVARLENLTWLDIEKNMVEDSGVAPLTKLSKLTHLDLGTNEVTDEGVQLLTELVSLRSLFLNETRVKNAIELLTPLTGLEVLHLDRTDTPKSSLVGLSNLVGIKEVSLFSLTDSIDEQLLKGLSAALPHIDFLGRI